VKDGPRHGQLGTHGEAGVLSSRTLSGSNQFQMSFELISVCRLVIVVRRDIFLGRLLELRLCVDIYPYLLCSGA